MILGYSAIGYSAIGYSAIGYSAIGYSAIGGPKQPEPLWAAFVRFCRGNAQRGDSLGLLHPDRQCSQEVHRETAGSMGGAIARTSSSADSKVSKDFGFRGEETLTLQLFFFLVFFFSFLPMFLLIFQEWSEYSWRT